VTYPGAGSLSHGGSLTDGVIGPPSLWIAEDFRCCALFGTILVYMAARPVIGEGLDAMVWTVLVKRASAFDSALLNVAFVFLLLGYGTKVGLAPLHAWLPDAHAEGPTPISAVLSEIAARIRAVGGP
jgi:formate hydrogenlyase subunit 3/multisubunit Na+/H+ antiporter MnhD subunit